jgi:hypothetical protein
MCACIFGGLNFFIRRPDFEHRLILVRESIVLGEEDDLKTDGSQRDIHMTQMVYADGAVRGLHRPLPGFTHLGDQSHRNPCVRLVLLQRLQQGLCNTLQHFLRSCHSTHMGTELNYLFR